MGWRGPLRQCMTLGALFVINRLCAVGAIGLALLLTACGGGGGGGGSSTASTNSSTTTATTPALTNFTTLTVDGGLNATSYNAAYVSVTICAPGSTTNCQTIDHVLVDTGSTGLRLLASSITPSLLAALPTETDASSNPIGECYGGQSNNFGSVRQADFKIGGESVASMPFQAIGDTSAFANLPSACTDSSLVAETTANTGFNGIIGLGVMATDCDAACTTTGGSGAAAYYVCPSSGCAVIARAASTTAPFQQLPNPVAAMSVDNNGTLISLPAAPAAGESTMTGTIYFGIGTQANNGLGSATVLATATQTTPNVASALTATYGSTVFSVSYIDSGSSAYSFNNFSGNNVTTCAYSVHDPLQAVFCPSSPVALDFTLEGTNSVMVSTAINISNFNNFASNYAVRPGIGYVSTVFNATSSAVFGLPFFYGRKVYTAIENRTAGSATGPYVAF